MWIPVITLASLLGHTSRQFQQPFPQNGFPRSGFPQTQSAFPQGTFPQTGFPSIAQSSILFSQPKQCVQQVDDTETLLKIVSKIVEDIPNICVSNFKSGPNSETFLFILQKSYLALGQHFSKPAESAPVQID